MKNILIFAMVSLLLISCGSEDKREEVKRGAKNKAAVERYLFRVCRYHHRPSQPGHSIAPAHHEISHREGSASRF